MDISIINMEFIFPFSYNLDFNSTNPENQIILWKIENYNSYLTDFISNPIDKYIKFKYNLSGKDIIFTYYTEEKFVNVENLSNEFLEKQLETVYECENLSVYEVLTKIETCIENMPDDEEEVEEVEEIVYPKSPINTQVKAGKLVTELNNKMGLTIFDTTIYDDYEKPDNTINHSSKNQPLFGADMDSEEMAIFGPKIKFTPLEEVTTSESLDLSMSISTNTNISTEISDIKISEYVEKLELEYENVNLETNTDLSDIIINSNLKPTTEDLYSSLVLSDSDFGTFYENLNVKVTSNALNEKEILSTCLKILKSEPPITDEQMKKYAFTETSIIKMLIKEVVKASSDQKILIKPRENNIFVLDITLKKENWTNPVLVDLDVELEIIFPKLYYPYAPPQINILSPKFSDIFLFSIGSLDYLKQEFWNPSNTLAHTLNGLAQIINQYGELDSNPFGLNININSEIIQLWSALDIKSSVIEFKIDFTKLSSNTEATKKSALASGTGYGNDSCTKWDIKKFMKEKENKTNQIIDLLAKLVGKISSEQITPEFVKAKLDSILHYYLYDVNVLEITNKLPEYNQVIKILQVIKTIGFGDLENLVLQLGSTVGEYVKVATSDKEIAELYEQIIKLNDTKQVQNSIETQEQSLLSYDDLKSRQFESTSIGTFSSKLTPENISGDAQRRIMREFSSLKKSLPFNYETSVFFRYDEAQMNKIKFLITGPKDTPYQDGCYIFDMILPANYPKTCPKVEFKTTGRGSVRFNPNLYNCGKVCLSLLGTWSGRPEEAWNENSTMLQLFVSIQSLILIDHPYFNEPGYQSSYGTASGMASSGKYNAEVRLNNIKWAIIDSIVNPDPCFADIIKVHFTFKKDQVLSMASEWANTNSSIASQLPALKAALAKL